MKINFEKEKGVSINPKMIGLFFEDINYAADGGLYAELLENRCFSFMKVGGDWGDYTAEPDYAFGWKQADGKNGSFRVLTGSAHSKNNPFYARLSSEEKDFYITNKAYEGLFLKKGKKYNVVFYARSRKYEGSYFIGTEENGILNKLACIPAGDGKNETFNRFREYRLSFEADKDYEGALFAFGLEDAGNAELDYISVIPEDSVLGVFRPDLFMLLKELKPGFIRFPGGCIIEGNTLDNRYVYKNTLREPWDRKTNWNRWSVHGTNKENNFETQYSHYNQTLGLGFYEYFLLCEAVGAKALPVLNVGFSCQYQNDEIVPIDSDEFQTFVQDALDLVEFANGPADSKWGSLRAKMGHTEPFGLEFLGIGNEQWQTKKADFFERYLKFEKAVHEKYPYIKLIGSAGPDITSEKYTMAWDFYRKHKDEEGFAYALDEHYYVKPEWLFEHNTFYDDYDRKIKVFSGEYAAHPVSGFNMPEANTLYGALSEAAFMTGVERNADEVVMASYAPLFARVNYAQWSPDMIWFDAKTSYGTPSYYVQKLFANNMGDKTLPIKELTELRELGIFVNASYDSENDRYIVKAVNKNAVRFELDLSELAGMKEGVTAVSSVLSGNDRDAYNCIEKPDNAKVTSRTVRITENVELEPYSFTVITF